MHERVDRSGDPLRLMEVVPARAYLGAALASIGLSALLRVLGQKEAAIFVGQWPPTFLLFALAGRLLRPSRGEGFPDAREAMDRVGAKVGGTG